LAEAEAEAFLTAWHLDDRLHREARELWHLLAGALSFQEYRRLLGEAAVHLYLARDSQVYPVGGADAGTMLGVVRAAVLRLVGGERGEVIGEFARLLIAARGGAAPRAAADAGQAVAEGFLILDPEAWMEVRFDLGPLLEKAQARARITAEDISHAAASRGRFLHLLRPSLSPAMPVSELDLLRAFDGATATADAVRALERRLGAPRNAVASRVGQLRSQGTLVPVRSAAPGALCA
jgi:hypothetical protein